MSISTKIQVRAPMHLKNELTIIKADFRKRKWVYLIALPIITYYIIFSYWPMYGAIIAFKNFSPGKGIWGSPWVGFRHFMDFFNSFYFQRLLRNSILINVYSILFHFPAPIIFALLLNEIRNNLFKRTIQTITYMPHFISIVVICGLLTDFLSSKGLINDIISFFGFERISFLLMPQWFRTIYIGSAVWQQLGWGSIIYVAALAAIDTQLYKAAVIDGAEDGNSFGILLYQEFCQLLLYCLY